MDRQYNNHKSWQSPYIIAAALSISTTATITLAFRDLCNTYPFIEAGALVLLVFSVFFIGYKYHKTKYKKQACHEQTLSQTKIDHLINLSAQLKKEFETENQSKLIDTIQTAAFALKKETEALTTQSTNQNKAIAYTSKNQPASANEIKKLEDSRIVFLTSDTSDRHQIIMHLTGWQIPVTVCGNAVRTFAEILFASDNNTPYDIAIIDQYQLDMDPVQFANSVYSEPSLQNISLIYLGPENPPERDHQLTSAGYSHILPSPINKSLLYNALHTTTNTEHQHSSQNVASFINHYQRDKSALQPLDILIAANPVNLKRIKSILKTTKHQVFTVENGEHALNALDSHHFDLAIFEFEMPIMNGIEAIKLYRFTHQNDPWMPFILFSPEANIQLINESNELDIDVFLTGNIQQHSLLSAIKQAVMEQDKECQIATLDRTVGTESFTTLDHNLNSSSILGKSTLRDLEELGSGQEFVHNLINSFIHNSEELLHGMKKAITENKHQLFIDQAYAFKDGAGSLGALAVYKASIKASHLEPSEFKNKAKTHLDELEISFDKTRKALLDYLTEQHSTMQGH